MRSYGFENMLFLVNNIPLTEFMDGDDAIQAQRRNPAYGDLVGADGNMVVYENADKSGEIVANLQQTSPSNAYLSGLLNAAENSAFVPVQIVVKNVATNELIAGSSGYIVNHPEYSRGAGVNGHSWTFVVEQLDMALTGA